MNIENQLDYSIEKLKHNQFTLKILRIILIHFSIILFSLILFKYLHLINSQFSIDTYLMKIFLVSSKTILWTLSAIGLAIFIGLVTIPGLRSKEPLNLVTFIVYSVVLAIFYSYLSVYYEINFFVEFHFIVFASVILLVIFCSLQGKFTLFNVPCLPYVYIYSVLFVLIIMFGGLRFYMYNLNWVDTSKVTGAKSAEKNIKYSSKVTFNVVEYICSAFGSFIFIFYLLFDLQFILAANNGECNRDKPFYLAINLLTKDVIQMFFLFNSFLLNLVK